IGGSRRRVMGLYNLHRTLRDDHQKLHISRKRSMAAPLVIRTVVSMPFQENTYVISQPERRDCLVIDPGLEPDLIVDLLKRDKLDPVAILNTHGHADHIGGNGPLKQVYPHLPVVIGVNEAHLLTDANANLSAPFGMPVTSPPADQLVREGDV